MFTGIVQAVGSVQALARSGTRAVIAATTLDISDVSIGDSIAVNGVCLTVVARNADSLEFDVSAETSSCTVGYGERARVNLEKALRLSDRLGGHLVTGHIDGVGVVESFEPQQECRVLTVAAPPAIARYVARKGSIAIDGVSLTVNAVDRERFSVNLIPHTLQATNLADLRAGARVNLEVDLLARYAERLSEYRE